MTETYEHVLFDVADGLAIITLNRPDKLNAWTPTMEAEVRHATRLADGDAKVRAIIITGAGKSKTAMRKSRTDCAEPASCCVPNCPNWSARRSTPC